MESRDRPGPEGKWHKGLEEEYAKYLRDRYKLPRHVLLNLNHRLKSLRSTSIFFFFFLVGWSSRLSKYG